MTEEYDLETNGYNYSNLVLVGWFMTIEEFLNTNTGRFHFHYVLNTFSLSLAIVINNLNLMAMSLFG